MSSSNCAICILDKENYLDESLKLLTFIGFVIVYDYQFLHIGQTLYFPDRAVFLKGKPRQVYMRVFSSYQFILFGPAL